MKKIGKIIILYIGAMLLQVFVGSVFLVPRQCADFLLCITIFAVLTVDDDDIVCYGSIALLAALMYDSVYGLYMGIGMASLAATMVLLILLRRVLNIESFPFVMGICLVACFINRNIYWILAKLGGNPTGYIYMLKWLAPELVLNMLLCVILFIFSRRVADRSRRRNWYL